MIDTPISVPVPPEIDPARLRGVLAVHQIPLKVFAEEARVARCYFSRILHEHDQPGELTRLRIVWALSRRGIAPEEVTCAS